MEVTLPFSWAGMYANHIPPPLTDFPIIAKHVVSEVSFRQSVGVYRAPGLCRALSLVLQWHRSSKTHTLDFSRSPGQQN